jgi:multidrug efflux system membrane fusion protein
MKGKIMIIRNILPILTLLLAVSCRHSGIKTDAAGPLRVRLTPVVKKPLSLPVHTSGTLVTSDEMKLSFKTGGIVSGIFFREGDKVKKGAILATLDLLEIKANAEQAKVAYDKALRDFTRADTLWKQSSLSLEKKQNAETALEIAKKSLEIAQFNLMHSRIEAPSNGIIMKQFVKENELVSSGYPVFLFGTLGKYWKVETSLSDRDVIRVNPGDSAEVTFDAWPGVKFKARVYQVGEMSNPYTGTYETELTLKDEGYRLASGFVASAEIYTSESKIYSLVPVGSVIEANGRDGFIYVIHDGTHAKKVMVSIVAITGTMAAVTGIPEGYSEIVSEGMAYLRDGATVEVVK